MIHYLKTLDYRMVIRAIERKGFIMTLKKAMLRGVLGFPLGVFLSYTITIIIALFYFDTGDFGPVVPQLTEITGNEITAVILQYVLSGVLGFAFAAGSAVFEVDEWGITKQTIIHFFIGTVAMFPIAYLCYWMEHSIVGILSYITTFVIFYVIIWFVQMNIWKRKIQGINNKMQKKK